MFCFINRSIGRRKNTADCIFGENKSKNNKWLNLELVGVGPYLNHEEQILQTTLIYCSALRFSDLQKLKFRVHLCNFLHLFIKKSKFNTGFENMGIFEVKSPRGQVTQRKYILCPYVVSMYLSVCRSSVACPGLLPQRTLASIH